MIFNTLQHKLKEWSPCYMTFWIFVLKIAFDTQNCLSETSEINSKKGFTTYISGDQRYINKQMRPVEFCHSTYFFSLKVKIFFCDSISTEDEYNYSENLFSDMINLNVAQPLHSCFQCHKIKQMQESDMLIKRIWLKLPHQTVNKHYKVLTGFHQLFCQSHSTARLTIWLNDLVIWIQTVSVGGPLCAVGGLVE